jgi:hypothetical protein
MTKTEFCDLWAAKILYEKNTSMGSVKELLAEFYDSVLRNHKDEERKHTYFNGFEYVTKDGDY